MKLIQIFSIVGLLQATFAQKEDTSAQAYPPVHIINSTPYPVTGRVKYLSWLCRDDNYKLGPAPSEFRRSRGICLITDISCNIRPEDVPGCDTISCKPYSSSGTSYSQFSVNQVSQCAFEVSRRVNDVATTDEEYESRQAALRGSSFRVLDDDAGEYQEPANADDYMPDEETLEEIEERELDVIMDAREAIADILDDELPGEAGTNFMNLMQERKLNSSKCNVACQACKLACDVKLGVKERICILACFGNRKCINVCKKPRELCHKGCGILPKN